MTNSDNKNTVKITSARVLRILFGVVLLVNGVYLIMSPLHGGTFDKIAGISFIMAGQISALYDSKIRNI